MTTELATPPAAEAQPAPLATSETPAIANVGEASSSPTIGTLVGALAKAQGAMAHASKDATNPHFGKTYAELSSVIDAAKEPLSQNGIAMIQRNLDCRDGVRVQSILAHESGEWISDGVLYMPVAPADIANPQRYGAAQTYARRYAYMTMVGLAPADDDANSASPAPATASPQAAAAKAKTLTWPFGDQKGTPLTDMPDKDLAYMVSREVKDDRYKASNLEMRAACQAVLDGRKDAAPAASAHEAGDFEQTPAGDDGGLGAAMDAQDAQARLDAEFPAPEPAETEPLPATLTQGERRVEPHELIPLHGADGYERAALQNQPDCPLSAEVMLHLCAVMAAAGYATDKADAVKRANGVIAAQGAKLNSWAYGQMTKMIANPTAGSTIAAEDAPV